MIVDLDDFHDRNHRLDLLEQLRAANPLFRCTLFAVPALCTPAFVGQVPDWCELAVHGWQHGDPPRDGGECRAWGYDRMSHLIVWVERHLRRFANGFKAPGWQISDGCYQALHDHGWWVADQHLEDGRRPKGLLTYLHEDAPDRWHGHIQNVCGNGLEERFDELRGLVACAESFQFASEAAAAW